MSDEIPRLLFLEQAAVVLRGMTGYVPPLTVEVGEDREYKDINQFPWIGLLPGPGSRVEWDVHEGGDSDLFSVLLFGYVQGDGTTSRTLWLLRIIRDCQRALHQALEGAFAAFRPGTTYHYADHLEFGEEDLIYRKVDTGAEFLVPMTVRIPDTLAA